MPPPLIVVEVVEIVPETRWWMRAIGRSIRPLLRHRFTPEGISIDDLTGVVTVATGAAFADLPCPMCASGGLCACATVGLLAIDDLSCDGSGDLARCRAARLELMRGE